MSDRMIYLYKKGEHPMQVKETREKMCESLKGKVQSQETKDKRSKSMLARTNPMSDPEVQRRHKEAIRARISERGHWAQTAEAKRRISETEKRLHAEGRKSSPALRPEVAQKISKSLKGRLITKENRMKHSKLMKEYYANGRMTPPSKSPEARRKISEKAKARFASIPKEDLSRWGSKMRVRARFFTRPTSPERFVMSLCEKYSIPLKYVGNGEFWLEHEGRRVNPDFIEASGKPKIVEVFGDYWHKEAVKDVYGTEEGRRSVFCDLGFDAMILWESELKSVSEGDIAERLASFLRS